MDLSLVSYRGIRPSSITSKPEPPSKKLRIYQPITAVEEYRRAWRTIQKIRKDGVA